VARQDAAKPQFSAIRDGCSIRYTYWCTRGGAKVAATADMFARSLPGTCSFRSNATLEAIDVNRFEPIALR
jgi:hypothetical protein